MKKSKSSVIINQTITYKVSDALKSEFLPGKIPTAAPVIAPVIVLTVTSFTGLSLKSFNSLFFNVEWISKYYRRQTCLRDVRFVY